MQCEQCGASVIPSVMVCPSCAATVAQLAKPPLPLKAAANQKKDISWLVFSLGCIPLLLISYAVAQHNIVGDDAKMSGYFMSPAIVAAGIAGLLGKLAEFRFRLTWVVAYAVLVVLLFVGSPTSTTSMGVAASRLPNATGSRAPVSAGRLNLPWPAGWTVLPAESASGVDGVSEKAVLMENSRPVAAIEVMIGRDDKHRTLAEQVKVSSDTAVEEANRRGLPISVSTPVAGTLGGRPSIEWEFILNRKARELSVNADSLAGTQCTLIYATAMDQYEKYKPSFDELRSRFSCP